MKNTVFLGLLLSVFPVFGNMRAPAHALHPPSSTLYNASDNLKVRSEQLDISCQLSGCHVRATYHIMAKHKATYLLEFVLPANIRVKARINKQNIKTVTSAIKPRNPKERMYLSGGSYSRYFSTSLHQATFSGTFKAGYNKVIASYTQPMSAYEDRYGYFTKSRFSYLLRYEIWPLKQWKRSDNFVLQVNYRARRRFSLAKTLRLRGFMTACTPIEYKRCRSGNCDWKNIYRSEYNDETGYRVSRFRFTNKLPDALNCWFGDRDLMPK